MLTPRGYLWVGDDKCVSMHTLGEGLRFKGRCGTRLRRGNSIRKGGRARIEAFKRPAAAVWGNGLWGSVGAAGRSYD